MSAHLVNMHNAHIHTTGHTPTTVTGAIHHITTRTSKVQRVYAHQLPQMWTHGHSSFITDVIVCPAQSTHTTTGHTSTTVTGAIHHITTRTSKVQRMYVNQLPQRWTDGHSSFITDVIVCPAQRTNTTT